MKKILPILAVAVALIASACDPEPKTLDITVKLMYENQAWAESGINVNLASATASFDALTDAAGTASFTVPSGIYTATASFKKAKDGNMLNYNGTNGAVSVAKDGATSFDLNLVTSVSSQIVIKELYHGGCLQNDGVKTYASDKYVILYNNSEVEADASNICFGFAYPANGHATNKWIDASGKLMYTDSIPCGWAYWGFTSEVKIPPYSQIVVSIYGAIDHSATHNNSVNLGKGEYYVMYDPESGFNSASYYPAPAAAISSSHYLKAYKYAQGNAWALSVNSPSFFIFKMSPSEAEAFNASQPLDFTNFGKLIPASCIVDYVEVFYYPSLDKSVSRALPSLDAGHVNTTSGLGHTVYRNVDKEATEALPENAGKLVYNYAGGTADEAGGTTDPSGIDAEASIAAGAHIIYMDTNNSTKDFHQRNKASIK